MPLYPDILVVSRPKLDSVGKHYGLDFQDGSVVQLESIAGIYFTNTEGFASGFDVFIERIIPGHQYFAIKLRLQQAIAEKRQYDTTNWNCESFVNLASRWKG